MRSARRMRNNGRLFCMTSSWRVSGRRQRRARQLPEPRSRGGGGTRGGAAGGGGSGGGACGGGSGRPRGGAAGRTPPAAARPGAAAPAACGDAARTLPAAVVVAHPSSAPPSSALGGGGTRQRRRRGERGGGGGGGAPRGRMVRRREDATARPNDRASSPAPAVSIERPNVHNTTPPLSNFQKIQNLFATPCIFISGVVSRSTLFVTVSHQKSMADSCDSTSTAAHEVLSSRPLLAAILGGLNNAEDLCVAACVSHLWCDAASIDTIWKPVWLATHPPARAKKQAAVTGGYKAATKALMERARREEGFEAATGLSMFGGSSLMQGAAESLARDMGAMAVGPRKGPRRL